MQKVLVIGCSCRAQLLAAIFFMATGYVVTVGLHVKTSIIAEGKMTQRQFMSNWGFIIVSYLDTPLIGRKISIYVCIYIYIYICVVTLE